MTVNSFSSISLDPALIMWAPDKRSSRFKYFENAKHFAVHVLNSDQFKLCNEFVKNKNAFDTITHSISKEGVPLIDNCLARFQCIKFDMHDAGDHKIIIGKVESRMPKDIDMSTKLKLIGVDVASFGEPFMPASKGHSIIFENKIHILFENA